MRELTWSIIQYTSPESSIPVVGILDAAGVHAAPAGLPTQALDLYDQWSRSASVLRDLDVGSLTLVDGARLAPPITFPRKVICAGANYYDHAEEMGTARPDPDAPPFFFLKPPTTAIIAPDATIPFPDDAGVNLDWEAELAVVISDRCKRVSVADALDHVAGYTIANDVSARGFFHRPAAVFPAFGWDWYGHKALDGLCPIGPGVVPHWLIDDASDLSITLAVNGVMKQNSNTSDLVVGIAGLISAASKYVTLEPGDIILTGTPAGVGMPRNEFLAAGDVMTIEIDGLGRLENRVGQPVSTPVG